MRITCRHQDAALFEEIGFGVDEVDDSGAQSMVDEQANYGNYEAMLQVARNGVVFFGHHDAGCEYDGALVVSDGSGQYQTVRATVHEEMPLVRVRADGSIAAGELEEALAYYASLAKAKVSLGIEVPNGNPG